MTIQLRGRAATLIRPGAIVKQVLMGEVPLATGETVTEAAIVDLHNAYKSALDQYNQLRPRDKRIHGMKHHSFYIMFKFAQLLRLVELVREEPMQLPPPGGSLYSIKKVGTRVSAIRSVRRVFRLTDVGREDERSWMDLTKAWKEQWPAPQRVVHFPTLAEALAPPVVEERPEEVELELEPTPKKRVGRPRRRKEVEVAPIEARAPIPSFKWVTRPSARVYRSLLVHLKQLSQLDQSREDVVSYIDHLSSRTGDWSIELEDRLANAKDVGKPEVIARVEQEKDIVDRVYEGFIDRDLAASITALEQLVQSS